MPVVVAVALLVVLVALTVAMAWQQRRGVPERAAIYSVEDSIVFVRERLGNESPLGATDVRRILEWAVRYLQDPAVAGAPDRPPVMASRAMAEWVQAQAAAVGHRYEVGDVTAVLEEQAAYVASIGAVGDPVEPGAGEGAAPTA